MIAVFMIQINIRIVRNWRFLLTLLLGMVLITTLTASCRSSVTLKQVEQVSIEREDHPETRSPTAVLNSLPAAPEIQTLPLAEHPRLLVTQGRFAELEAQIETDETIKEWYDKLYLESKMFLNQAPPKYEFQDEIRMLVTSQLVLKRVSTLALIYNLNHDERYRERIWQELKAASAFPSWNPAHFLDTAEMTHAFAIAYDWLYADWTPVQRAIIRSAILEKGLKPALVAYQQKERWTETETNWNQVCNGGVGLGSLAVLDEYPEIASQALSNALTRLPKAMKQYSPDGSLDEGPAYWHYATYYNTLILSALDTAFGTDFDLANIADFGEAGLFPLYITSANGLPFNFGDSREENQIQAPELLWMANRFSISSYAEYEKKFAQPMPMDLIWFEPELAEMKQRELPSERYFRDTELVSMNADGKGKTISIDFKAGNNKVGHSHLDVGTFVLDAMGTRWASDLGADYYKLPEYYHSKRWTYYRLRAEGHNTLVINPTEKPDQRPDADTKIIKFDTNPEQAIAIADLSHAYNTQAASVYRGIELDKRQRQVLIQDEIEANEPVDLFWFMHTAAKIEIGNTGTDAMLYKDGVKLWVKLLSPSDYQFEVMNAEPLETSPNPPGQAKNEFQKLTVVGKQVKNLKLAVLLVPLEATARPPKKLPQVGSLADW